MSRSACGAEEVWGARSYTHLCTQHGVTVACYPMRAVQRRRRLVHHEVCSSKNEEQLCQSQHTALALWQQLCRYESKAAPRCNFVTL